MLTGFRDLCAGHLLQRQDQSGNIEIAPFLLHHLPVECAHQCTDIGRHAISFCFLPPEFQVFLDYVVRATEIEISGEDMSCLLYTSDAADE